MFSKCWIFYRQHTCPLWWTRFFQKKQSAFHWEQIMLLYFLILYSWSNQRIHHLARSLNLRFRYIDNVFSLNSHSIGDFTHRICLKESEIKNTTDTLKSASYLDLHLKIDGKGKPLSKLYDKRNDFSFRIVNFPSTVATSLQYLRMEFSYHNIRYARACCTQTFRVAHWLLSLDMYYFDYFMFFVVWVCFPLITFFWFPVESLLLWILLDYPRNMNDTLYCCASIH